MDHPTSPHPTDQTLSGFGLGTLDDGAAGAVTAHLGVCPRCRERVAALSGLGPPDSRRESRPVGRATASQAPPAATVSYQAASPSGRAVEPGDALDPGLAGHPDYEIKRELGRGGMGVVYLAYNKLMGRDEVLKVMGRHLIDKAGVSERFLREIRAVARLRHENIVAAYSATRIGASLAFAMEYVEGLDLSRLVRAKGPLPVALACNFAYQAALGLQHAHEEGLVHRDIKPGNLMLTRRGKKATVKVLDFGLAKATRAGSFAEALTQDGQALGTPDFIAPEQITNAPTVNIRADLYSLGASLYFLLTGRPPFRGNSLFEVYQAHISREPEPLTLVRPEVPPELAAVVARMMAKDPARRFPTPRAAAQALKPFFQGEQAAFRSPEVVFSSSGGLNRPHPPGREATAATPEVRDGAPGPPGFKATAPEVRWESLIDLHEDDEPDEPPPARSMSPRLPAWAWPCLAAGVLAAGFLVGWLAIGLRVKTDRGELVFDGLPDDAVVAVDGQVVRVEWPGGGGPAKVSVPAGEHSVKVEIRGVEVAGDEVKIKAGDRAWIRVRLEPGLAGRSEPKPEPATAPRPAEVAPAEARVAAEPSTSPAPKPDPPPAAAPPAAAGDADVLYVNGFDDPNSGWPREDPEVAPKAGERYRFGYAPGAWFNSGGGSAEWSQPCPYLPEAEFQLTVVGRVLDATPESRGRWTVHVRPIDPNRRGFQVAIERDGAIVLEPSFWDRTALPGDPRIGPFVPRDFRTGSEYNTLVLRVRRRQVQVLCNGAPVGPPISYDWDLTPARIQLGVNGYKGSYRAEFDRIEIRKLAGEPAGPVATADALQPGSIWLGDPGNSTFTTLERDGERIKARFVVGSQVREIHGTIRDDRLRWLARDVKATSGKPGGDHEGVIRGDEVAMTWTNPGGPESGKFTLKLSKPAPATPDGQAARAPNLLYSDDFDDPRTGWAHEDAKPAGAVTLGHGYRDGVYALSHSVTEGLSYACPRDFGGDFQVEVSGRVLDATPESRGFWAVHILPRAPGARGLQVGLDRSGVLVLEPTFWHRDAAAADPRFGPIPVRNFRRGNRFNTLTLRIRKRQMEVLVNSVRVGPIVSYGWDLTPAALHLGLNVEAGITRAEFDRVEVREILSPTPFESKR